MFYVREYESFAVWKEYYEIIDWKQRLSTIIEFITWQFQYKWKYFYEFTNQERQLFDSYNVNITRVNWPLSLQDKIELFLAINDTWKKVSEWNNWKS